MLGTIRMLQLSVNTIGLYFVYLRYKRLFCFYSYPVMIHRPTNPSVAFMSGLLGQYIDGLGAGRPRFDSQQGQEFFSLLHSVQTGSWAHSAFYPMGTRGSFPWDKAAEA
jgi:hypothetical protein